MSLGRPGEGPNDSHRNGAAEAKMDFHRSFARLVSIAALKNVPGNANNTDLSTEIAGVRNLFTLS
jgi:hypothetical protein